MVTVVLICWKRFEHFNEIIDAWLSEPEVNEVLIWDNSGSFKCDKEGVVIINSQKNINGAVKYNIAVMAENDLIINADDDIMPKPGIVKQLLAHYDDDAFIGVAGSRIIDGWTQREGFKNVKEPVEVDIVVGYLSLTNKKNLLGFDFSKFLWYNCELEMAGRTQDKLKQLVVPADAFEILPEAFDENALCGQREDLKDKEARKWFPRK